MKKELNKKLVYFVLSFVFLILIFGFIFPEVFLRYFLIPALSPFFPDYSPFNATVTLIGYSAPLIINLSTSILVCEESSLSHFFNVSDLDRNLVEVSISPLSPFFTELISSPPIGSSIYTARIFSPILGKNTVDRALGYRTYARIVSARDSTNLIDTKAVDIIVIEINNRPFVVGIGVRTVWMQGDDSTFEHQLNVFDVEDGNQNSGDLTFNLTFLDNSPILFNISANGTMIFTPNVSEIAAGVYNLSVYNISVCVKDKGLNNIHPNITICGQDGGSNEVCQNFSLTITDENRAPIITTHYPLNLSFSADGISILYFNITTRDPDGTIPDAYWYVDDILRNYSSSSLFYEFLHTFGCGVSGRHNITALVTDGLLNTSLTWNASVQNVACPSPQQSGGGGGGFEKCNEKWACLDWNVCQNAEGSFSSGLISGDDFDTIKENCRLDLFGENCGLQIRGCYDINSCKTSSFKPDEIGHCYYVENPSCSDGVKNCHDETCELLIDCGGPCDACPTCSDGKRNQGELGKDCGGPCPLICPYRPSLFAILRIQYIFLALILLFLIIVVIQIIRFYRARKKITK